MQILFVIAVLIVALSVWVHRRAKIQSKQRWAAGANSNSEYFPACQPNTQMSIFLHGLVSQLMQAQHEQHQSEVEHFWMAQETINDTPSFSDNTWDM